MATNFTKELIVTPGKKRVKLSKWDPDDTLGWEKDHKTKDNLEKCAKRLDDLQYLMYAERKHALLIVLQGLDAAGKDGTIRHVMAGVNPQGCHVAIVQTAVKPKSAPTIFSGASTKRCLALAISVSSIARSMRTCLIVRVHNLVPKSEWSKRYDEINDFERMLTQNHVRDFEILSAHQQRRAEETIPGAHRRSGQALEDLRKMILRSDSSGTTTLRLTRTRCSDAAQTKRPGSSSRRIRNGSAISPSPTSSRKLWRA